MLKAQSLVPMPSNDDRPIGEKQARPSNALIASVFAVEKKFGSTLNAPDDDPQVVRMRELAWPAAQTRKPEKRHVIRESTQKVMELRKRGWSQAKISDSLNMSEGTVEDAILRSGDKTDYKSLAINRLHVLGYSKEAIAETLGYHTKSVNQVLNRAKKSEALALVRGGMSLSDAAKFMGVDYSTLRHWCAQERKMTHDRPDLQVR